MDIGTTVAWAQAVFWVFGSFLWLGRLLRGEVRMPPWIKRMFSSNRLIGAVIACGLIMSALSLYFSYAVAAIPDEIKLNISRYDPPYTAPMRVISDQTFEDQDIPLDGRIYQRCSFTNVCFLYDGGAFGFENSTVKKRWKVCTKEVRLNNYGDLLAELKEFNPRIQFTKKTVVPLQ